MSKASGLFFKAFAIVVWGLFGLIMLIGGLILSPFIVLAEIGHNDPKVP